MIIDEMLGKTFEKVIYDSDRETLTFVNSDYGYSVKFYHEQDCCENVYIDDICGDLNDLACSPILQAEIVSGDYDDGCNYESHTWTFYKFATKNGYVTVRWLGESNGYYSEEVSYTLTDIK